MPDAGPSPGLSFVPGQNLILGQLLTSCCQSKFRLLIFQGVTLDTCGLVCYSRSRYTAQQPMQLTSCTGCVCGSCQGCHRVVHVVHAAQPRLGTLQSCLNFRTRWIIFEPSPV